MDIVPLSISWKECPTSTHSLLNDEPFGDLAPCVIRELFPIYNKEGTSPEYREILLSLPMKEVFLRLS